MRAVGGPRWQLPAGLLLGAVACQVLAALMVLEAAPDLASGQVFAPDELAIVHLYGLATLSVAIFAVLLQLVPVILRQRIPLEPVAAGAAVLVMVGALLLAQSLRTNDLTVASVGGSLLGCGGAVLVVLVAIALIRAARAGTFGDAGAGLACALVWFAVAIGLGGTLVDNLRNGVLAAATLRIIAAHAVIAIIGWVGGTILATVLRLGPMLALAHGHSQSPGRVALLLWNVAVLGIAVGLVVDWRPLAVAGSLALAGAVIALGFYLAGVVRHRNRRVEAPLAHLLIGALAVAVATAGIVFAATGTATALDVAVPVALCLLIGFGAGAASGHMFKILPMVVWTGRYAALAGTGMAPRLSDMYPGRLALLEQVTFGAGLLALVVGCLTDAPALARAGAGLLVLAALTLLAAALLIVFRTPRRAATAPARVEARSVPGLARRESG
jgi:nitrite reductase (NO-forming)